MGVFTGQLGAVNGMTNVRNWTIEEVSDPKSLASSATRRGMMRKAGIKSWTGSISLYGGKPPSMPGDISSFVGYRNSTTDVRNTTGIRSSGSIIIDSVQISWNWNTAEIISQVLNFSGDGALVHASGLGVIDATVGVAETPLGTNVMIDSAILPDVLTAQLTINVANQAFVSSSTSGWTGRKRGAPFDFQLAITQYNESGLAPVNIGSDCIVNLYTNASQFWILKWCQLQSITGVTVDIESAAIIQQTLNFNMQGISASTLGQIRLPGEVSDWWPATP